MAHDLTAAPVPGASVPGRTPFHLKALLESQAGDEIKLIEQHVNPTMMKVLKVLGFDRRYVRGQGPHLWDDKGQKVLDCVSGFGVFGVGRNHPIVRDALKQAMDLDLPGLPKFGAPVLAGQLAKQLLEVAPGYPGNLERVFFCNSGAEGVETAMKYSRAATGRDRIVYCKKGYHGLTMGSLSLNGGDEFKKGFGKLLEAVTVVPFNDLPALEAELSKGDVAAFVVEPIQGKGVYMPSDDYLPGASALCKKHGTIFVADEVQTGFGRTGKWFACEHWGVVPDILVCSKAMSGGYVPVAAVLSRKWIHDKVFSSMDRCMVHSSTFKENDLAMVAGLAALHVMKTEKIVENAALMGGKILERLKKMVGTRELVKDVRGKGVMIGIEFGPPSSLLLKAGWKMIHAADQSLFPMAVLIPLLKNHHVLAQVGGHNVDIIKLLPTMVIDEADVNWLCESLETTISNCHSVTGPMWEIAKGLGGYLVRGGN